MLPEEPKVQYIPMIRDMPADERPRERLAHFGAQALSSAELLAIIIRTGTGSENVLRLAERLLMESGGLTNLAQLTIAELTKIKGIGPAKAIEIKAAIELGRRITVASPQERPRIASPADAANLLMSEMMYLEQEHLRAILLNTKNYVLKVVTIYIGSLNSSVVRVGEVFRAAIKENAAALIIAHNHPSGDPTPSPEDIYVTTELVKAGQLLNIELLDHVIIGRQKYISLKERGLGFPS